MRERLKLRYWLIAVILVTPMQAASLAADGFGQADYERAQFCIGKSAGVILVLEHIKYRLPRSIDTTSDQVLSNWKKVLLQEQSEIHAIESGEPSLDRTAGQRAYESGYAAWEAIAKQSEVEQLRYWKTHSTSDGHCDTALRKLELAAADHGFFDAH